MSLRSVAGVPACRLLPHLRRLDLPIHSALGMGRAGVPESVADQLPDPIEAIIFWEAMGDLGVAEAEALDWLNAGLPPVPGDGLRADVAAWRAAAGPDGWLYAAAGFSPAEVRHLLDGEQPDRQTLLGLAALRRGTPLDGHRDE